MTICIVNIPTDIRDKMLNDTNQITTWPKPKPEPEQRQEQQQDQEQRRSHTRWKEYVNKNKWYVCEKSQCLNGYVQEFIFRFWFSDNVTTWPNVGITSNFRPYAMRHIDNIYAVENHRQRLPSPSHYRYHFSSCNQSSVYLFEWSKLNLKVFRC